MCVIGGGITGNFVSYYLLRNGYSVTILDSDLPSEKTSLHNCGLITPSFSAASIGMAHILSACLLPRGAVYISPRQVLKNRRWFSTALRKGVTGYEQPLTEFCAKSLELYKEFIKDELIERVDLIKGLIGLYKDSDDARKTAEMLKGRFIDEPELSDMGFKEFEGGVLVEDLCVNPSELFNQLRTRLARMGARIILGKKARLEGCHGKVNSALIGDEKLTADVYVVAAGARSREICKPLAYDPQILPARGLVMIFDTGGAKVVRYPALFEDSGICIVQHDETSVRITSFFELVGFKDAFGESRKKWLLDTVDRHLIGYDKLRLVREGVGYRPCTPDQLPVMGQIPGCENAYIASGGCRLGLTLAPIMGLSIASMIAGEEPSAAMLKYFDPSRFA